MDKSIFLPLFNFLGNTSVGQAIANSTYAFAVIEVFHLFGIVLLLGGSTVMSLRLCGLILKNRPVSMIARELGWYTFFGLAAMLVSGILMVASAPNKYYSHDLYWWKMLFFWVGFIFHFTLYRKVTRSDNPGLLLGGITAVLAIFLWYGTGAFGRAIGFF